MNILEQCQIWHENDEYQKIIDALEAIPAEERTPEMDSELARAYNNQGAPDNRELLRKAIALLEPHEAYFAGDHFWNFRMGYAYYYLDQEGIALRYFEQALAARPGDEDTENLIDRCKRCVSLPRFGENFRDRTETWWETFAEMEAELRQMMDADKKHERGDELVAKCDEILHLAFENVSFELGFNGEKYELILTPEGNKVKLFELVYFQRHAPAAVLENWNILVGRQPLASSGLRFGDWEVSGDDVQVWVEQTGKSSIALTMYSEKLLPLLQQDEGRAEWLLYTITDQVLGEIPAMRYIDQFDVARERREEPSILLTQLPRVLADMGLDLSTDAGNYLENSYTGYEVKPNEDPEADWRLDIIAGSTNCPALINGYMNDDDGYMDDLHADGVVAGFLCYPLDSLREENGSKRIFDFRDRLEAALLENAGADAVTLTGGATGIYCGYLDFIAWDIFAVLDAAQDCFKASGLPWANFHVFRRNALTVPLISQKDGEDEEAQAARNGEQPEDPGEPEMYTEQEMVAVQEHIDRYFGKCDNIFHEIVSPDIHVDICIVPPAAERDYYTLVTMGMGAHRMNVPEELAEHKLERAELAIALPADWQLDMDAVKDEQWYWPIRLLKSLARLPGQCDTWLGWGHTVDHEEFFAPNTALCGAILIDPRWVGEDGLCCVLPNGEEVNFYQVIPLYSEEMEYKLAHRAEDLLEKMSGVSFVVRPDRPSVVDAYKQ